MVGAACCDRALVLPLCISFLLFLSIPFFNVFIQSGIDKLDGMVDDTSMSLPLYSFLTKVIRKGLALWKCVTDFSNKAVVQLLAQINCILR